jgi:hypothetical protein
MPRWVRFEVSGFAPRSAVVGVVLAGPVMRNGPSAGLIFQGACGQLEQLGQLLGGEQRVWVIGQPSHDVVENRGWGQARPGESHPGRGRNEATTRNPAARRLAPVSSCCVEVIIRWYPIGLGGSPCGAVEHGVGVGRPARATAGDLHGPAVIQMPRSRPRPVHRPVRHRQRTYPWSNATHRSTGISPLPVARTSASEPRSTNAPTA